MKATVTDLAWWAEAAHGLENEDLVLVEADSGEKKEFKVKKRADLKTNERMLLEIESLTDNKVMPKAVTITSPDAVDTDLTHCDAVFWTRSSVDKFLIPYYVSQRLLDEAALAELIRRNHDDNTMGIGHIPPSHTDYVPATKSVGILEMRTEDGERKVRLRTLDEYLEK